MIMYKHIVTASLFFLPLLICAQQSGLQPLEHEDFDIWKTIENEQISNNGRFVLYQLEPGEGDPTLVVYDGKKDASRRFNRADAGQVTADSRYAVFLIHPPKDTIKAMRRRKVKKDDLPPDTLAVLEMATGALTRIARVPEFHLPEKWGGWLAYPQLTEAGKDSEEAQRDTLFTIRNLETGAEETVPKVRQFTFAEKSAALLFASAGQGDFAAGLYYFSGADSRVRPVLSSPGRFRQLALDEKGRQAAFLLDPDTTRHRIPQYRLHYWKTEAAGPRRIVDAADAFLPEDWIVGQHGKVHFSQDGAKLYFGIRPAPLLPDTNRLEEEIVNVEVWTHHDKRLYTQQENRMEAEKKRTYTCVWHVQRDKLVQIGRADLSEVELGDQGNAPVALGIDERPYLRQTSWEGFPVCADLYLIDLTTGERAPIARQVCGDPDFSPNAKYIYWYSHPDSVWMAYSLDSKKLRQITTNEEVPFYDELNDRPMDPYPYGIAGWTKHDDFIIIYDRYDAWLIDPEGEIAPNNITLGRKDRRRMRYVDTRPDMRTIQEVDLLLFHFYDEVDKEEGYLWFDLHTGLRSIAQKADYAYQREPVKAKDADRWLFTRESYQTFPDLLYGRDQLREFRKISDANPQQANYKWGSVETYHWTSAQGESLEGLLYKPENFDPEQQYPMMVYFYERNSDNLHNYIRPYPHRSIINFTFYTSRGYLVFVPDIVYREGYPGKSAYDCVVPGVNTLIQKGFVDPGRIGLQGHSWGGYQSAYLISQTDLFRCAESGAPVVNMTSAYGGIRWGSGLSRMFQYEHTQSRIGGSLWEYPMRYLENSPLFYADKINTPVLILHNDNDGAVPWYQGIEFFVALRRLNKPVWMLNYNNEPHWPVKRQNRKDFQRRMQQFFDHYLMDAPAPRWMEEGVSPIEKGVEMKYEAVEADGKR